MENNEYESVYDFLVETYPDKRISDNGNGVYVVSFGTDKLYVPSNSSLDNINIMAEFLGRDNKVDFGDVEGYMKESGRSNYWVLVSHGKRSFNTVSNIIQNENVHVSTAEVMLFSASGNSEGGIGGLNETAKFIRKNEGYVDSFAILAADGSYLSDYVSDEAIQTLVGTKTPVVVVASAGGSGTNQYKHAIELGKKGVTSYLFEAEKAVHTDGPRRAIRNKIPEIFMGLSDELGSYRTGYRVRVFNSETDQLESITVSEIFKRVTTNNINVNDIVPINVSDLFKVDNFNITETPLEASYLFSNLKNIDTTAKINFRGLSFLGNVRLYSDSAYVSIVMTRLKKQIKSSGFLNTKTQKFRSSSGIPGCISNYINAYYNIMGQLMSSLNLQIDSVMSVAQAIVDMNKDLTEKAKSDIGEAKDVNNTSSNPSSRINPEYLRRIKPFNENDSEVEPRENIKKGQSDSNGLSGFGLNNGNAKSLSNVDVKKIIDDNFGKLVYFQSKDGKNLYIQKPQSYTISVPEDFHGGETNLIIFSEAAKSNTIRTRGKQDYYNTNTQGILNAQEDILDAITANNEGSIVATTYFGVSNSDVNEMLRVVESIEADPSNIIISGWSAGGNEALTITDELLNNHSNLGTPQVFLVDSNHTNQINNKIFQNIKENGVKCTLLTSESEKTIEDKLSKLISNNIDLDLISVNFNPNGSEHLERKRIAIFNDVFGYLINSDDLPSSSYANTKYTYQTYDYETNSIIEK